MTGPDARQTRPQWDGIWLSVAISLSSDGLIEVFDRKDEDFGFERMDSLLAANRDASLDALGDRMLHAVRAHGPQLDDQTWLFIRLSPHAQPASGGK